MSFVEILIWVSSLSFLSYGILSLSSLSMVDDFERFGLGRLRMLTGLLELLGGLGLLVGLRWHPALLLSSGGLALMMLIAFGFRIKVRDSVADSLPSLVFMVMNFYILVSSLRM